MNNQHPDNHKPDASQSTGTQPGMEDNKASKANKQPEESNYQGSEGGGSAEDLMPPGRFNTANGPAKNMSQRAHEQKTENKFSKEGELPETD